MLKEFKDFISKGNVIDLGVAVVMGAAFGAVINSFVENILMPIIGALTAGIDFNSITIVLLGVELGVGVFINNLIKFIIIGFSMFIVVMAVNKLNRKKVKTEEVAPTTKICPFCKTEISIEATRCPNCTSELK